MKRIHTLLLTAAVLLAGSACQPQKNPADYDRFVIEKTAVAADFEGGTASVSPRSCAQAANALACDVRLAQDGIDSVSRCRHHSSSAAWVSDVAPGHVSSQCLANHLRRLASEEPHRPQARLHASKSSSWPTNPHAPS